MQAQLQPQGGDIQSSGTDDVDVIIPVHNGAAYIRDSVASVLSQTVALKRVIVVDDGSSDETAAVVSSLAERHPSITLQRLKRKSGVSAARNAGIRLSDSPFVAFLDADDIWLPTKLSLQLAAFRIGSASVGFIYSSYFPMDEAGNELTDVKISPPFLRGKILQQLLLHGNIMSGSASSVLVKRNILQRAGLFDERLYYGEDWDLWLRLAAISDADFIPQALVGIRVHSQSTQGLRANADGLSLYLQVLRVYGRWEDFVLKDPAFMRRLRNDGFWALLRYAYSFAQVEEFYRSLKTSDQDLARRLYSSRFDLWTGLISMATKRRLRQLWRSGRTAAANATTIGPR